MNLIINGNLLENCNFLDLGKEFNLGGEIEEFENSDLLVDVIVFVILVDNLDF